MKGTRKGERKFSQEKCDELYDTAMVETKGNLALDRMNKAKIHAIIKEYEEFILAQGHRDQRAGKRKFEGGAGREEPSDLPLTPYELARAENIERNERMLRKLSLPSLFHEAQPSCTQGTSTPRPRKEHLETQPPHVIMRPRTQAQEEGMMSESAIEARFPI